MKTIFATLLIAVIGLTGCDYSNSQAASAKHHHSVKDVAKAPKAPKSIDRQALYLSMVKHELPQMDSMSDVKIVKLAVGTCDSMSSIHSTAEMRIYVNTFVNETTIVTDTQAARYLGLTIAAYCPDKAQYVH
jgi:hypothetical protein